MSDNDIRYGYVNPDGSGMVRDEIVEHYLRMHIAKHHRHPMKKEINPGKTLTPWQTLSRR